MFTYFEIFKFSYLNELAYPAEIVFFVIRKFISLGFLILFWYVIAQSNPDIFAFKQIISYFLISEAVADLSFVAEGRFGREIQKVIKAGSLSNVLIKPVNTLYFLYTMFIGGRTTVTAYSVLTLLFGIVLFPPKSLINIPLFLVSLILTAAAGAGINTLIGVVGFYSPEASSIKNIFVHISRVFSGALVPLTYFPKAISTFVKFTPFPVLSFYPTTILQSGGLNQQTYQMLLLSLIWAILLLWLASVSWKKAIKNFDGVGI